MPVPVAVVVGVCMWRASLAGWAVAAPHRGMPAHGPAPVSRRRASQEQSKGLCALRVQSDRTR